MKFSFIIPVYNNGADLNPLVSNIENMHMKDYEILLVNDGSQDASADICERLAERNTNIHCFHQENRGVSVARNNGLKIASGEYVLFFDADDTIESEKLSALFKKLDHEPKIDMAIFGLSFDYYHNGILYRNDELKTPIEGIQDIDRWSQKLSDLYHANSLSPVWNKVFRRSFLVENGLYFRNDMFLYEDLEFSVRCMALCNSIFFEPDVIYHYRQSEDEGNAGRRLMRIEHLYSVVNQIEAALDKINEKSNGHTTEEGDKSILIPLYLVLAREKIAVSNMPQIKQVCEEFAEWYRQRNVKIPPEYLSYANLLLNKKSMRLILRRKYTKIRHKIAVRIKNTGIYQKLKG